MQRSCTSLPPAPIHADRAVAPRTPQRGRAPHGMSRDAIANFAQVRTKGSGRAKKVAHFVWANDPCTDHPHSKPCPPQQFSRASTLAPRPASRAGPVGMCKGEGTPLASTIFPARQIAFLVLV
jgi:hypothetical protein